ncbi:unnamed protein product [Clonostachys byssicola]|uniref:Zn(2)-C6 fungal-type domain-containing protein n=1 Tax=Clonostachys byssicola TaxID=160290 RepID=A0A9N9UI59_9HYPO|nr:unnamed protein product [Clonostachys byssicola]
MAAEAARRARSRQCDQKWPVCSHCKRRDIKCSGPTSLVKFVHGGSRADHRGSEPEPLWQHHQPSSSPEAAPATTSAPTNHRFIITDGTRPVLSEDHAYYSAIGVIEASPPYARGGGRPTTMGDRTASRLLNLVQHDEDLDSIFNMKYLKFLPQRIPNSGCLRDAASLFCSTLTDYRRKVSPSESQTMDKYGKALRSLRRALRGDQAGTIETLASITLVNRAESYILGDWPWKPFNHVHAEAVLCLSHQLGPPRPGDELYAGLLFENFRNLGVHFMKKGTVNFFGEGAWGQALSETALSHLPMRIKPHAGPILSLTTRHYTNVPMVLAKLNSIYSNPHSATSRSTALKLMDQLSGEEAQLHDGWTALAQRACEIDELVEVADAYSFVQSSYRFQPGFLGEFLLMSLSARVVVARMQYDLSVLYDDPEDVEFLWDQYRKICILMWKFVPAMLDMEALVSFKSMMPLAVSFEGGDLMEQERLLDMVQCHEEARRSCRPTGREEWRALLHIQGQMLTGRIPMEDGQDMSR